MSILDGPIWSRCSIALTCPARSQFPAPINSRLNVVVRSPAPFGLGRNGCWPSRWSQLPWALPIHFFAMLPLNDRRRAAHSIFKIGRLFLLFLLSCPTLALLVCLFVCDYPSSSLGWRCGMSGNSGSCRQPN